MRASNDFLVVCMAGIGTALFLTQLLIVSQQIVAANNRVQTELAEERNAVPVNWMALPKRPSPAPFTGHWGPPPPPPSQLHPSVEYPKLAAEKHIGGFVEFDLTLSPEGAVVNSKVVAEVPRGYGFADAAAKALAKWRFKAESNVTGSKIRITRFRVTFKPDD